jgi:predicted nuclease of predicted toxin-antitoxin system
VKSRQEAERKIVPHRFLADLNISPLTVAILQRQGWDVVRASELLPATAADEEVLLVARQERRTIITHDLDFSALLALQGLSQPSLITLRLATNDPVEVARRLTTVALLLVEALNEPCAVTIEDLKVRVRELPID